MDQSIIDKKTKEILALHCNPKETHEFICACANAKSFTENKLTAESMKIAVTAHMRHLVDTIGKI